GSGQTCGPCRCDSMDWAVQPGPPARRADPRSDRAGHSVAGGRRDALGVTVGAPRPSAVSVRSLPASPGFGRLGGLAGRGFMAVKVIVELKAKPGRRDELRSIIE